ncbi:hypothetical protein OHB56_40895 [Streptomyces sp. NBC_01635]|nr:hypothetical protein OHB56_00020 [Streptomyces sp. NBC_01635]WTD79584.1 hypothetical protein OHB56_40895 [Streptomyces sp. NBC_01635]
MEQLTRDPDVFRAPGDDTGAVGFMNTWIRTLREQADGGTELRTEG